MAKLKSMLQSANSGNLSKVEVTCNHVEKVKTMRCFWEMKFEPEVSMQAQICSILSIFPRYQKHQQGVVKHSFSHASFTAQTYIPYKYYILHTHILALIIIFIIAFVVI